MDVDAREELAEATSLLSAAKGPRVRKALSDLVETLQIPGGAAPAAETKAAMPADACPAAVSGSDLPAASGEQSAPATVGSSAASTAGSVAPPSKPRPTPTSTPAPARHANVRYTTVNTFSWDQGGYDSPKVSVYVPLAGVSSAKDRVSCSFTARGFDLTVKNLEGKNYRLLQNNLEKDIIPGESKFLVKRDKVVLKLQKTKLSYGGYDHWNNLTAKKPKKSDDKDNPQGALMDMMKDMYDEGDDNMKKVIGEAMMKSQRGENAKPDSFDDPSSFGSGFGKGKKGSGLGDIPNFDDYGMDDDLNLDKGSGDGDWGDSAKDDFGFGSKPPPTESPEPLSPVADEDDAVEEKKEDEEMEVSPKDEGRKVPPTSQSGAVEGATPSEVISSYETLDD